MAWWDKILGNDPNDPNNLSGEELLGTIPSLVGGFEAARGRPIGKPLEMLGGLMEKQGEKRRETAQGQSDVMGQLRTLTSRFGQQDPGLLDANSPQLQAIGDEAKYNPQGASQQLTQMYNEELAQEQNTRAQGLEREKLTQARPAFDKSGRAWRFNPTTNTTERSPADDIPGGGNDPKSYQASWIRKYNTEHPFATSHDLAQAWNAEKVAGQIAYLNQVPFDQARNMAGKHIIDKKTGQQVMPGTKTLQDVNAGIGQGQYAVISDKALDGLDNINRIGTELGDLAQVMPKVLTPADKNKPFKAWATSMANRVKIPFLAKAGNADVAEYEQARSNIALEMQQILTNSTRPVALQELGIVMPGVDGKTDMHTLSIGQLTGIVPTQTESTETAWRKMQGIDKLLRVKRRDIIGDAGKSFLEAPAPPNVIEEPEMPEAHDSEVPGPDGSF